MKTLKSGYQPTYTTRSLPREFYRSKTRIEKRVRFADEGKRDVTASFPSEILRTSAAAVDDQPNSCRSSSYQRELYYKLKLEKCKGKSSERHLELVSGVLRREQTFTGYSKISLHAQPSKALFEGIRRKRKCDVEDLASGCSDQDDVRGFPRTILRPVRSLSFLTEAFNPKDSQNIDQLPRFSRYNAGKYLGIPSNDSGDVTKVDDQMQSPRTPRLSTRTPRISISLRHNSKHNVTR